MADSQPHPDLSQPQWSRQATDGSHELVLTKSGHRYVFRCPPGEEAELFEQLAQLVRDPETDLTWFDAAVLSHQMGRRMSDRLDRAMSPEP